MAITIPITATCENTAVEVVPVDEAIVTNHVNNQLQGRVLIEFNLFDTVAVPPTQCKTLLLVVGGATYTASINNAVAGPNIIDALDEQVTQLVTDFYAGSLPPSDVALFESTLGGFIDRIA